MKKIITYVDITINGIEEEDRTNHETETATIGLSGNLSYKMVVKNPHKETVDFYNQLVSEVDESIEVYKNNLLETILEDDLGFDFDNINLDDITIDVRFDFVD